MNYISISEIESIHFSDISEKVNSVNVFLCSKFPIFLPTISWKKRKNRKRCVVFFSIYPIVTWVVLIPLKLVVDGPFYLKSKRMMYLQKR